MAKKTSRPQAQARMRCETRADLAAAELQAAIEQRRFAPWHAATLLASAETASEFEAAVQMITRLVGRGQRREVSR